MPQKVWLRCKEALDRALAPAKVRVVLTEKAASDRNGRLALFPAIDALLREAGFTQAGFTSYSQYAADVLYAGPSSGFELSAARAALPYLARNLAKYRRHSLKRALRRMLGMAEWPDAVPARASTQPPQQAQTRDPKGG